MIEIFASAGRRGLIVCGAVLAFTAYGFGEENDTVEAEALKEVPYGRKGNPISLRNLDLRRTPSETQLRLAGQLGSALTPNRAAEPSKLSDPAKRKLQEEDNLLFGEAMNLWNRHDYKEAVKVFKRHQAGFSDSAWSGEVDLHMGCEAQFNGRWEEARGHFQRILESAERGSDIYQKAKLRLSVLLLEQGQVEESVKSFAEMLETEKTWERTTYAQNWIRQLAVLEGNLEKLRVCGSDSVAFILERNGRKTEADGLRTKPAHGKYGYSLAELRSVAAGAGLRPRAVRAAAADLATLPIPFIAHYEDEHYVVVFGREADGALDVFDPRLKHKVTMTPEEFAAQWSGLALLTDNQKPKGIADATSADLNRVGGCCGIPRPEDDIGPCGEEGKSCRGMPVWEINPVNLNMMVQDIPLWYDNPVGPNVEILLTYNSLDALNQLRPFGNKWTFNYLSYAMEGPGGVVTVVMPHGRRDVYTPSGVANEYTSPMKRAGYTLLKTPALGAYAYTLTLPDGTQYLYGVPPAMVGGTSSLLLGIKNKSGEGLTLTHNANGRLTKITDALSRDTNLFYNAAGLIDHINDPFGRTCSFTYDFDGNLIGQTDMGGLSYSYTYTTKSVQDPVYGSTPRMIIGNNLFIASITTPSGSTSFFTEPPDGVNNSSIAYPQPGTAMWANFRITITEPEGDKQEFHFDGYSRDTWHRDGKQYEALQAALASATTPAAYDTAGKNAPKTKYDFTLQGSRGLISSISYANSTSESFSSFTTNGQPQTVYNPSGGDDRYTYNAQGQVLTHQNPRDYTTTYEYYPNGLDLKKVTRPHTVSGVTTTITVAEYTYDANRRVKTIKDAGLNETKFDYTSRGLLEKITNARNEETIYLRNGLYQVTSITRAGQTIQGYTYDAVGRVATSTDANGTVLTYEYDNLNRRTKVIYSDGTFEKFTYTCCGNVESVTDRQGRTTNYSYDGDKRLVVMRDPVGRITQYDYDAAGNLTRLVDGNGNATRFEYDARNRMNKRIFADGKFEGYVLDGNGNRTQITNARTQTVSFGFDGNDNLTSISGGSLPYTSFTYDDLDRRLTMSDASGETAYGYNDLDQLTSVDGPLTGTTDKITYTYDALGRRATQSWADGTQTRTLTYDALGRLATEVNPLGSYGYNYPSAASNLVSQVTMPLSYTANYAYAAAPAVRRLSQRQIKQGSTVKAQFDYLYDVDGTITKATESLPSLAALEKNYAYDAANQLLGDTEKLVSNGTIQQKYTYRYDAGGNRTGEQIGDAPKKATYNRVNQVTALAAGGWLRFSGQITNEPATVTVQGKAVSLRPGNKFEADVAVTPGTNTVNVTARDGAGNVTSKNYQVSVPTATAQGFTYDFDGNMLTDGTRSYTWDELNRLTKITYADNSTTEITYDGLNRWVRITEKNASATITANQSFVWSGMELVERRESVGTYKNRIYLPGGQLKWMGASWAPIHYMRDHLGSVRSAYDGSGNIVYTQDFSPYGKPSTPSGMELMGIGFTGHYFHEKSGLHLAPLRAYSADLGRWISRDPLKNAELKVGSNLYSYVHNNVVNVIDPDGRCPAALLAVPLVDYVFGTALTATVGKTVWDYCMKPQSKPCEKIDDFEEPPSGDPHKLDEPYKPGYKVCVYRCKKAGVVRKYFPPGTSCDSTIPDPGDL